jgi:hypothetical protein
VVEVKKSIGKGDSKRHLVFFKYFRVGFKKGSEVFGDAGGVDFLEEASVSSKFW